MDNNNELKYRIVYDAKKVLTIIDNDSSITYTSFNSIISTLQQGGHILRSLGIDCTLIDEFVIGQVIIPLPENPILEYDILSLCPADSEISRKAYWNGKIEATEDYFRIFTPVLHFKNGERLTQYDAEVHTQVDRYTTIQNPFSPGEMVNEYEFFVNITKNSVLITDAILMGIQKADMDGTFNKRLNYAV